MNNTLWFAVDKKRSLCFVSEGIPMDQVYLCFDLKLYWIDETQKILIGMETPSGFAYKFERMLPLVIEQEMKLDTSIQKNLGYYLNEIMADRSMYVDLVCKMDKNDSYPSWIGMKYLMCETYHLAPKPHLVTWLYNDKQGNIILEVAPMFSWSHQEVPEQEELDRYFEFLKNYKPVLKQIIPRESAQLWIELMKKWYAIFEINERKVCQ